MPEECIWDSQPIIGHCILHALKACNSTPWVTEGAKDIMSDSWEWWRNSFPWLTRGIFPWITPQWYYNHWTSAGRVTRFYLWSLVVGVSLIDAYFATDHRQNIIFCKRVKNKSWWLLSTNTWFLSNCKYKACNLAVLQLLFDAFFYLYSICKRLLWKSQAIPPGNSLILIKLYKPTPNLLSSSS